MTEQSRSQNVGAIGHKFAMLQIQRHPDWLSRDLTEDFGVDAEAELTEHGVKGEILKLQFKSSESVERSGGKIKFSIDRKYLDYAMVCRYPVVFVTIDITAEEAWYLWLQDWILLQRQGQSRIDPRQSNFTTWVDEVYTLSRGLDDELKNVARWRGNTQLVLSLLDAMRAGASTQSKEIISRIVDLVVAVAPDIADATLDVILEEAVFIGERMRGTLEGNKVGDQLFDLVRRFGNKMSAETIVHMVKREETYSRTSLIALGILYDEFFEYVTTLSLVELFLENNLPHVGYYCALREHNPGLKYLDFIFGPGEFCYAGLKFEGPSEVDFANKYANRGPSAILDYLIPMDDA